MFMWMIKRDLLLAMRRQSDVLTTLFFFIIVVSLFPLSVGPEMNMLLGTDGARCGMGRSFTGFNVISRQNVFE